MPKVRLKRRRERGAVRNNVKTKKRRNEGDARKMMIKMGIRMRLM